MTYLFFPAYFISVYISFIIVKNCGFVMVFVILAIYFQLKTTILNVKTKKPNDIEKKSVVRFLFDYWIH